jgi:hypothetical protein
MQASGQPPGWYPNPAGGSGLRYWDGTRWSRKGPEPGKRHAGVHKPPMVLLAIVAILVLGLAGCAIWERSAEGSLTRVLDALVLPPEIHVVDEGAQGNVLCFDNCLTFSRLYSSSLPRVETYQIFTAKLRSMGYECGACSGFSSTGLGLVTGWLRSVKEPEIHLLVFSTADADGEGFSSHLDLTSPTHVQVSVSPAKNRA